MTDMISRADAIARFEEIARAAESADLPDRRDGLRDAIVAIRALPVAQVAVKPLEWQHVAPQRLYEAYGLCRKYQVRVGSDGIIRFQAGHMGTWLDADSVDAAKAAAQADYDARIRSALNIPPAPDPAQIRAATPPALGV